MKKFILFILLAGFLTTANAQKMKGQEKKAKAETEYVTTKMNLNTKQASFLQAVLLEKYASISKQTKGVDLTKEEKKAIKKNIGKQTKAKLMTQFSKNEVKEIYGYIKEYNKNKKKK